MKTDHLLIIRFSAIGDVAMMVPVVASLAKQYPQLRITVLSQNFARTFYNNMAPNVSFMSADFKGENHGIHGLNLLYKRLAAKNFTAIADMHNVLRSKYLRLRFNLDQFRIEHIDKHRKERRQLCDPNKRQLRQLPTSFENYADVLRRLGYPIRLDFQSIFPSGKGNLRLLSEVIGEKKLFQQWIGIAAFAGHKGKIYPPEKMKEVIRLICARHPSCRIFLFGGGKREYGIMDAWMDEFKQCINASAHLDGFEQELILMSNLDVMLSMDSANMHLASMTGTRVVSVWGATHPFGGFLGWQQPADSIVQLDMSCRPCSIYGSKPCCRGDYACINDIEPAMIADKIDSVINQ